MNSASKSLSWSSTARPLQRAARCSAHSAWHPAARDIYNPEVTLLSSAARLRCRTATLRFSAHCTGPQAHRRIPFKESRHPSEHPSKRAGKKLQLEKSWLHLCLVARQTLGLLRQTLDICTAIWCWLLAFWSGRPYDCSWPMAVESDELGHSAQPLI